MTRLFHVIPAFLLFAQFAFSQSQATTGNIHGRVLDGNGAAVLGLTITVVSQDTGISKSTTTDKVGHYIFVLLRPGSYVFRTEPSGGFAGSGPRNVAITIGSVSTLDITVQTGPRSEVDIYDRDSQVESGRTSISLSVDEHRIRNLPSLSRNFMDFALLTPGIVRDPIRGGTLAIGGQLGPLNSLQVDGVSDDNTYFGKATGNVGTGRAPFQFSMDAVKEFQINQSGFSAEFGRAAGGVINVVTKSGTYQFHGGGFWFFRDESLDSNSPNVKANQSAAHLPNRRSPVQSNDFGGTFGGPIIKDRTFFFAAYEGRLGTATNVPVLKSLQFAPAPVQSLIAPKLYPTCLCSNQDSVLVKIDLYANDRNQAWMTYNQQRFQGRNFVNSGLTSPEENNGIQKVDTLALIGGLTSSIRANWYNEFRFQLSRDKQPAVPHLTTPQVMVNAFAAVEGINDGPLSFGGSSTLPREITIARYQLVNNQTLVRGGHTIKFGTDLMFDRIFNLDSGFFHGEYSFSSYTALDDQLANPLGQYARNYRQSFAGPGTSGPETHPNSTEYGYFLQDDWRVFRKLTMNIGLRYDYQAMAKPKIRNRDPALLAAGLDTSLGPSDKNNFAPRVGLSYAFNEKTVLRGGYGIYYGRTPAIMTGLAQSQNGVQVLAFNLTCSLILTVSLCPIYPAVLTTPPAGGTLAPTNLSLFARNYDQPFTQQVRGQFERQIFRDISFFATYEMFRGRDLPRARNANLGGPVGQTLQIYDGLVPTGESLVIRQFRSPVPFPGFRSIGVFESTARSVYHGFALGLDNKSRGPVKFLLSYTFSHAKDDRPDPQLQPYLENPTDIAGLYGRSDMDVRHRFIFAPVFETGTLLRQYRLVRILFRDFIVSGIYTAQSGPPYSAMISGDPNNDLNMSNDRVPETLRNQYSTPPRYILDIRLGRLIRFGKRSKMIFFAEAFNALNRSNISTINNTKYTYLTATTSPPRLALQSATFGTTRVFVAPNQLVNSSNASSNRSVQLGLRIEF